MKNLIPPLLGLATWLLPLYASAQSAATVQTPSFVYTDAYRKCSQMAVSSPSEALAESNEQLKISDNIGARHCRAMALYALMRYPEAVNELLTVERQIPANDVALLNYVTRQTARALNLAKKPDAALVHLQKHFDALRASSVNDAFLTKLAAETLLERALLRESYAQYGQAIQELDHAISLNPTNEELLYTRARVFIALGDNALARQDLNAILRSNPNHRLAREMLARAQTP